ncbi:MAG TPA: HEAT repeat domain-containing protein, partial [Kofleriaceae bacterium]
MTNLTRWKLACALFASLAGYGVVSAHRAKGHNAPATAVVVPQGGTVPFALRRPIHVAPETLGVSQRELIDRIEHARNARDVGLLADKLGAVGDDEAIDALTPMLGDPRRGVPEAIIGAFGMIGTQHAIDIVVEKTSDERPAVRRAAITALGQTASQKAETTLIALADRPADPMRDVSVAALGALGTDNAVTKLVEMASAPELGLSNAAITALGSAQSPKAQQALRQLVESSDPRVVAAAIAGVDVIDDALATKLEGLVRNSDVQIASAAMGALAHVGEAALPVIREAAHSGNLQTRLEAVGAIAQIGGDKAIEILADMLKDGDRQMSALAASELVAMGGAAREALIEAAMSERGVSSGALEQLQQLQGEDVDNALLAVVRQGTAAEKKAALPRLVKAGNPEALKLAIDLADSGGRTERYEAMQMLAQAGTPQTLDALVSISGKQHGVLRVQGLELAARQKPGDSAITRMLADSLTSGRRDEATYAAAVLGRMNNAEAQQAMI